MSLAVDDEVEPPTRVEPDRRRPRRPRAWLTVAVVIAALAGLGLGGALLVDRQESDAAARQALAAAQSYVLRLTNVDAGSIDKNFADIADGATGEFRDMHARSGARLRKILTDNAVRARGTVTESVVKSATEDSAVVVLFVDQAVTSTAAAEPVIDRSRIRMTMTKVDGRWLARKVELL